MLSPLPTTLFGQVDFEKLLSKSYYSTLLRKVYVREKGNWKTCWKYFFKKIENKSVQMD